MSVRTELTGERLTAFLSGELDHHSAGAMREEIDEFLQKQRPNQLVLDFGEVTFMDSSGIGLVMGRYKLCAEFGCTLEIHNLSEHAYRVMRLAGLSELAALRKKKKEDLHETRQ